MKKFMFSLFLLFTVPCTSAFGHSGPQKPLHKHLKTILTLAQQVVEKNTPTSTFILFASEIRQVVSDLKTIESDITSLPIMGYKDVRSRFEHLGGIITAIAKEVSKPEDLQVRYAYWLRRSIARLKKIVHARLIKKSNTKKTHKILMTILSFTQHMNIGVLPIVTQHIGTKLGRVRDFLIHKLVPEHWGKLTIAALIALLGSKVAYDAIQRYRKQNNLQPEVDAESTFFGQAKKYYKLILLTPLLMMFMRGGGTDGMILNADTGALGNQPIEYNFVREEIEAGESFVRRATNDDAGNLFTMRSYPGLQQPDTVSCSYYALYHLIVMYNHHHHGTPLRELTNRVEFNRRFIEWRAAIKIKRINFVYEAMKVDSPGDYEASDHTHNAWIEEHDIYIQNASLQDVMKAWYEHMLDDAQGFRPAFLFWANRARLRNASGAIPRLDENAHEQWLHENRAYLEQETTFWNVFGRWRQCPMHGQTVGNILERVDKGNPFMCHIRNNDDHSTPGTAKQDNSECFEQYAASESDMLLPADLPWLIQHHVPELSEAGRIKENILVIDVTPPLAGIIPDMRIDLMPGGRYKDPIDLDTGMSPMNAAIIRSKRLGTPMFFIVHTNGGTDTLELPNVTFDWPANHGASAGIHYFTIVISREGNRAVVSSIDSHAMRDNSLSRITHAIKNRCIDRQIVNELDGQVVNENFLAEQLGIA